MGLNRRKLKDWATRRMLCAPAAERFALYHIGRHQPSLVTSIPADGGSAEDRAATVERVTSEEVNDHIEAWPGRQQYLVKAFGADSEELGEFAFAMTAVGTTASADLTLAPPENDPHMPQDMSGHPHAMVTLQQMRHNEGLVRWIVELSRSAAERDSQIIAAQQRQIDVMEGRRLEFVQMLEKMYSDSQARELEHTLKMRDDERKEKMLKTITGFVLPEIAKRAGLPLPGANGTDVADEIMQMFVKLPEATQAQILEDLSPEDAERLLSLFEKGAKADKGSQPAKEARD